MAYQNGHWLEPTTNTEIRQLRQQRIERLQSEIERDKANIYRHEEELFMLAALELKADGKSWPTAASV